MTDHGLTFYFDGLPVGRFDLGTTPISAGDYPYEPFRGLGHHKMQTQLKTFGLAECRYSTIRFTITGRPRWRLLTLDNFRDDVAS